jgi:GTP-binding protein YchF
MFSVGLVGLPNAGKSSLFNLITGRSVPAENFPFCTIDPSDAIVEVKDSRIDTLSQMFNSKNKIYSTIEFRDIAGLVKNAHSGEGLGNKFLSHIREVDLILLVVRTFENDNVIHVENRVNPKEDEEILMLELTLADSNSLEKIKEKIQKDLKKNENYADQKMKLLDQLLETLKQIKPAIEVANSDQYDQEVVKWRKSLNLLTDKPLLRLSNITVEGVNKQYPKADFELDVLAEATLEGLDASERAELGYPTISGLDKLIQTCFKKLNLSTYLTAGEQESRAWTFVNGSTAPECAGKIHSDFEKKFIKAEVVSFEDLIAAGGLKQALELGKLRSMGKDYLMKDGDVVEFKIGG